MRCLTLRPVSLAALSFALAILALGSLRSAPAHARDFDSPRLLFLKPDWNEAKAALDAADAPPPPEGASRLDQFNKAVADRFLGIAASPVPVLLPFDVSTYLRDQASGQAKAGDTYLSGFRPSGFFQSGPSGYDAVFTVDTRAVAEFSDIRFPDPIQVEISGFSQLYDLPSPRGTAETPVRDLDRDFSGIRRLILESHLRYTFMRYGVRYVATIQCYDAAPRPRRLACKQADRIAQKFLHALRLAGGKPGPEPKPYEPKPVERPRSQSPYFTYYAPGRLLPNTGVKNFDGVSDYTVYAPIRYPLAQAPSFANSQSFMNWGDCDQTGRVPNPGARKGAPYRCRVNSKPLVFDESAGDNYSYPWRDNFCEHRFFFVGQCGTGYGHQGQDIRPGNCSLRNEQADRCEPYRDDIVAVRDGMILRERKQEALYLVINGDNERVRFRYMHMNPDRLDEDGMVSGRRIREGELIGKLGNFNRKNNGTTNHLHFEAMVPTHDGWVRINPYVTLVSAYERLIGARGREVSDPEPEQTAAAPEPERPRAQSKPSKIEQTFQATQRHSRKRKRIRRH